MYVVGAPSLADSRRVTVQRALASMNTSSGDSGLSPHDLVYGASQANRNVFLAHDPSHGFSATNQKVFLAHDPSHGFSATNQNVSSSADDPNDRSLWVAALPVDFLSSDDSRRENGEKNGEEISIGSSGSDYYQI